MHWIVVFGLIYVAILTVSGSCRRVKIEESDQLECLNPVA